MLDFRPVSVNLVTSPATVPTLVKSMLSSERCISKLLMFACASQVTSSVLDVRDVATMLVGGDGHVRAETISEKADLQLPSLLTKIL